MHIASQLIQSAVFKHLERATGRGNLNLIGPDGRERQFHGSEPGPAATITVHNWRLAGALLSRGDIGLGEAHIKGWWDSPDLEAVIAFGIANAEGVERLAWGNPLRRLEHVLRDRLWRRNTIAGSRRNIMSHYDLGNDFYALWLDPSMSYSSALYENPNATLSTAQANKYQRILGKLGSRGEILEIGCGWGGFIATAEQHNCRVTALTVSERQYGYVRERAGPRTDLKLQDYRLSTGRYPAIVSIEMLEAVGERYWPEYFRKLRSSLHDDGLAVVQTITIRDDMFQSYRNCSDYIRHFIFKGGMLPSLARIDEEAAAAGLRVREVHSFGADYARTLREWLARFDAAVPAITELGYDAPFQRGWRLYLAMSAAAFASKRCDVRQITLAPARL